jgi:hypothetical protein
MGVTTTAYSLELKMIKKVRANNDNLAYVFDYFEDEDGVFGPGEDKTKPWQVESYDFDSSIDVYIQIFREAGYTKTAKSIDCEYADLDAFDYGGYDIWVVPPSGIKAMVKELENAAFEVLKAKGIGSQVTDRRGNAIPESTFEGYLSDIKGIKEFFNKAFMQGHYLVFAEA